MRNSETCGWWRLLFRPIGSVGSNPCTTLHGSKQEVGRRLVATFDSEQQLLAYVRWATLVGSGQRAAKFEQGGVLAGYTAWDMPGSR
jgi:hypothetical protein